MTYYLSPVRPPTSIFALPDIRGKKQQDFFGYYENLAITIMTNHISNDIWTLHWTVVCSIDLFQPGYENENLQ